jgi:ligand-binding SRPBCC domain-containing protein
MEAAMETFKNTVTIDRPAEEVFAFLADFENVPRWNYAVDQTRKASPGPVGVGTTYRQTRSIPSRSEEGFEVTAFEMDKRLAVLGQIGPFRARISYLLEAAAGGTRLTNDVALEPSPGVLRLAARLATPRVKAAVAENLSKLKEILEAGNQQVGA